MDWVEEIYRQARLLAEQDLRDAAQEYISIVRERTKKGQGAYEKYTPYGRSHKRRREKKGLQTKDKDLHFSGTMFDSVRLKDVRWEGDTIMGTIDFSGQAYRRSDQKSHHKGEPAANKDLAVWFEERQGHKVLKATAEEKEAIYQKFLVHVND